MPIKNNDMRLRKSAVMADTPDGGGAMVAAEVVDGQSNNVFPDVSTANRALGNTSLRKVFGVADTPDTDALLGASFAVLRPPADPLVHATIFSTPGWYDTRDTARELIERYMVKGPRKTCRIMDTHYAGSLALQLYQVSGADFPVPGDSVVLRNPDGTEVYVRVLRVSLRSQEFPLPQAGTFVVNIAMCDLASPLPIDVLGPPVERTVAEAQYALIYTTTVAAGTAFYGVKPLANVAAVGDRSVTVSGGIFSPLVPSATLEEPITDVRPLLTRQALGRTAFDALALPAVVLTLGPGVVLRLPTGAEPGTLQLQHGGTAMTTTPGGDVRLGTQTVGSVDWAAGVVTFAGTAPALGSASLAATYRPAAVAGANAHSASVRVTQANQSLSWVYAFGPSPAPGTLTVSYMAQGRWYELSDNGDGKLTGGDSSYGAGTVNFASGSVALTLGALPDVDSDIIYTWGDAANATPVPTAALPGRAHTAIALPNGFVPGGLRFEWQRSGTNYEATVAANGTVTGPAQVQVSGATADSQAVATFAPDVLPDGDITVVCATRPPADPTIYQDFLIDGGLRLGWTVGESGPGTPVPVSPGSVRLRVNVLQSLGEGRPAYLDVWDDANGQLLTQGPAGPVVVGAIDYADATAVLPPNTPAVFDVFELQETTLAGQRYMRRVQVSNRPLSVLLSNAKGSWAVAGGAAADQTFDHTPVWQAQVRLSSAESLLGTGLALRWGGDVYTATAGALRRGWHVGNGTHTPAGSAAASGLLTLTALPSNGTNTFTWLAAARSLSDNLLVYQGVFRVPGAPLKTGSVQVVVGTRIAIASDTGTLAGGDITGTVDFQRGVVRWAAATLEPAFAIDPTALSCNAVYLQYIPLNAALLGLDTARLPLDGRVPIYRPGGLVLVHHTDTTTLPINPTAGTAYSLGRQRVAAVVLRDSNGERVSDDAYSVDFDAGTVTLLPGTGFAALVHPIVVEHRIEDELLCLRVDISGRLDMVSALTHDYPLGSYVSSLLSVGDLAARVGAVVEKQSWTGWADNPNDPAPLAQFNDTDYPITVTNRGAVTEDWALIFFGSTTVRVVGRNVGQVAAAANIGDVIAPINPQTGAPYFSVNPLAFGSGWVNGNAVRFPTFACGAPAWVARTVLQGPASEQSDDFVMALRADVDRP